MCSHREHLARSRPFYIALMPGLGYPGVWDDGRVLGFLSPGASVCLKQADRRYGGEAFSIQFAGERA